MRLKKLTDEQKIRLVMTALLTVMTVWAVLENFFIPDENSVYWGDIANRQRADNRVNINTASAERLRSLNGIGEAKAAAIIEYREQNGDFSSVDELLNVSGISEKILENIRDKITV